MSKLFKFRTQLDRIERVAAFSHVGACLTAEAPCVCVTRTDDTFGPLARRDHLPRINSFYYSLSTVGSRTLKNHVPPDGESKKRGEKLRACPCVVAIVTV